MVLNVFFHHARDTELAYDRLLHNLSGISERSAISIPFQSFRCRLEIPCCHFTMYTEFKLSRIYGQGRADDIPRHVHPLVGRGNTLVLESFYVNSKSTNKGQ